VAALATIAMMPETPAARPNPAQRGRLAVREVVSLLDLMTVVVTVTPSL
jgi:hypothetical protein